MSQPDLHLQLRAARPVAPAELRERVRVLAAQAPAAQTPAARPRTRFEWQRALVIAVPVAAAVAVAVAVVPRGSHTAATPTTVGFAESAVTSSGAATDSAIAPPTLQKTTAPASVPRASTTRLQQYTASLGLRLRNADAVSEASKQAVQIAQSLGGFLTSANVDAQGRSGYANLVLRVPVDRVREAVSRLSTLGTVVAESVSIKDLQGQIDVTTRKIHRLQGLLAQWKALTQTAETIRHIDALTTQIERLQRGRSATVRTASLATIHVQLTSRPAPTPVQQGHGPLHRLGVIFRWAGIAAVYALALGSPLLALLGLGWLATRAVRRRREDRLLSAR